MTNEVNGLEKLTPRHLNKKQLVTVYLKKRSKQYQTEGYKHAYNITNAFLLERIFAFALDTCIMLLPIALWELLLLMILMGLVPVALLKPLELLTFALVGVSMFTFNPILSAKSGGQTLGKYFYDLKVVGKDHKETSSFVLILREILGISLPTFLLFLYFNIIGVFAYWILNFLFLLVHPKHISIVDMFLGTRIVVIRQTGRKELPMSAPSPQQIPMEEEIKKPSTTVDLHIHSNFSDDGQYNVEELFQMAQKKGLKTISICDHNSVKANLIAKRMSDLYHIQYIPGVELDCRFNGAHLRVLGYFINASSDIFAHLENESLKREKKASLERVKAFENFSGICLNVNEFLEKNRFQKISGRMIAKYVLDKKELQDHPLLKPYRLKEHPVEAMVQDLFIDGAPCNIEVRHPKLEDIVDIIHLTGGVAVLSWARETMMLGSEWLESILKTGIDGIEVFTPYYDLREMTALLKQAKDHKLFVTAGSDFHGKRRPEIEIGDTNCPKEAEIVIYDFLEAHQTG